MPCGRGVWRFLLCYRPARCLPARPRLVTHDRVVAKHLNEHGTFRQHVDFPACAGLLCRSVVDDGRTDGHGACLSTVRRAAAQQARCDHEDGEPPFPASGVGRH
jgi:hypothetical protein